MSVNIDKANNATAAQLNASLVSPLLLNGSRYSVQTLTSTDLSIKQRDRLWTILERNMRKLYETSSFGWHPRKKRRELFHDLSRFLTVRKYEGEPHDENSEQILAYTMFRFEQEEGHDVIYCYELQLSEEVRRKGLGRSLILQLEAVGRDWGMKQIMLTVLKENKSAQEFYRALGFLVDPTSPDFESATEQAGGDTVDGPQGNRDEWESDGSVDECDYQILSKSITL